MSFTKGLASPIVLIMACLSISQISAQTSWKFGIGGGLNYSKFNENISAEDFQSTVTFDDSYLGFTLSTRAQKTISKELSLAISPSINFLSAGSEEMDVRFNAVNISFPVQLHLNVFDKFYIGTGPSYGFLANINVTEEGMKYDVTPFVDNRHGLELKHSIGYVIDDWVDVSLSFNHAVTPIYDTEFSDFNGNVVGTYTSRFQYIQLGFVVRR